MWPYWLIFSLPAGVALLAHRRKAITAARPQSVKLNGVWVLVFLAMTVFIGCRFEVGADWDNYFHYINDPDAPATDPGYELLNWASMKLDLGMLGVNLIGGAIFSVGLAVFCCSLPRPWLALAASVPYLVIVVAMGYSRQGMALGCEMLGLVALGRNSILWFVLWVLLGATFHKSAILLLPIAALAAVRRRLWMGVCVLIVTYGAYELLLRSSVDFLYYNYVEEEYESDGALVRLLMNAVPAAILLIARRRFQFAEAEMRLWLWFAAISIALLGFLFLTPATAAVDRLALYMLPLQLAVFAHLPDVFGVQRTRDRAPIAPTAANSGARRSTTISENELIKVAVLLYYGAVQFAWLNYATHAWAWVPYRFYPMEYWF